MRVRDCCQCSGRVIDTRRSSLPVTDSWDFCLSQHDHSVPDTVRPGTTGLSAVGPRLRSSRDSGLALDGIEPGVQGLQFGQDLPQRRLRGRLRDLDITEAVQETRRNARGDDAEQGDTDQHQRAADQAAGTGGGIPVAVAATVVTVVIAHHSASGKVLMLPEGARCSTSYIAAAASTSSPAAAVVT